MKKGNHFIQIKKSEDKWTCTLGKILDKDGKVTELMDITNANNFPDLMIEIGNRNWVDLINKNK